VSAFEDVFATGMSALVAARQRALDHQWAVSALFLAFLSAFPDSHVVRRHGKAVAEDVRRMACEFYDRLQDESPADLALELLAWDKVLKQRDINPGTSADLTVATLFVAHVQSILPSASNND